MWQFEKQKPAVIDPARAKEAFVLGPDSGDTDQMGKPFLEGVYFHFDLETGKPNSELHGGPKPHIVICTRARKIHYRQICNQDFAKEVAFNHY